MSHRRLRARCAGLVDGAVSGATSSSNASCSFMTSLECARGSGLPRLERGRSRDGTRTCRVVLGGGQRPGALNFVYTPCGGREMMWRNPLRLISCAVWLVLLGCSTQGWQQTRQQANAAYAAKDYPRCVSLFEQAA